MTVVDDTNTQYIAYAGAWTTFTGSSRQWESTIHSTNTYGATASFQFLGNSFMMYGTIPAGSGTVYVDITIDGGTPTRVTRTSGSNNVYANVFYESPVLNSGSMHTVVFTNKGHSTDSSFQFDRVQLLSLSGDPIITSPPNLGNGTPTTQAANNAISSTTSSPGPDSNQQSPSGTGLANPNISSLSPASSQQSVTSLGQTVTVTQQLTKTGQPSSTSTFVINTPGSQAIANYHRVHLSAGAIAGITIGGLAILALFIAGCFALKRCRNHSQTHQVSGGNEVGTRQTHRSTYTPTPFGAQLHSAATESTNRLLGKGNTSVTRNQLEAHQRIVPASSNHCATDGDTCGGHSHPHGLNVGQEGSRQESACEDPPAYQPGCSYQNINNSR